MISLARIFALAGVILLGIGAFLPVNKAVGIADLDCAAPQLHQSLVAIDCFSDDPQVGFQASTYGLILLGVAVVGLTVAFAPRVGRLWALAFTGSAVVGVLYAYFNALSDNQLVGDTDWGWGVMAGGVGLLLFSAFIGTIRAGAQA